MAKYAVFALLDPNGVVELEDDTPVATKDTNPELSAVRHWPRLYTPFDNATLRVQPGARFVPVEIIVRADPAPPAEGTEGIADTG